MRHVYGVATRKGGQGKSTTVSTLGRLCALYGVRVLVIDLAQPGTSSASLRNLWPETEHGELATAMMTFQMVPPNMLAPADAAREALRALGLPIILASQPSWSGGYIGVLPWDELQGDAAAHLHSERVLESLIVALNSQFDIVLIDFPAEGGPLLTNALAATHAVILPIAPEIAALDGLEAMLRLMGQVRESGHDLALGGILLTRCDPKTRRTLDSARTIVQTILQAGEVEGEPVGRKLFPFAIRGNEYFEQAFRYGEAIWERTSNPAHWAGYVLLTEWLLCDAGLAHLVSNRRGPAMLLPDTRVIDISALMLSEPEVALGDFEKAHAPSSN